MVSIAMGGPGLAMVLGLVSAPDSFRSVTIRTVDGIQHETIHVFKAGHHIGQHAHVYPHTTVIARGSLRLWADGQDMGVLRAVTGVLIPAGVKHRFEILEDDTVYSCIHNVGRTGEIDVAALHRIEDAV